jgi:long-chain acyl-CoA synthetase
MNAFDYFFAESKNLDKNFVIGSKESISFPDLFQNCLKLSGYIKMNFGEDQKILIISPNSVFFIMAYLAIIHSGNSCIPLNSDIEENNLDYIIQNCNSRLSFVSEKYGPDLLHARTTIIDEKKVSEILDKTGLIIYESFSFDGDRLAEIIFTSGSTGRPKGVMLTHRNLIANTDSILQYLKLTSEDIIEVVLPFYYCYGLSLLHTHLKAGGSMVMNNNFMFLGSVLHELNYFKCTGFAGVPSHFQVLLRKSKSFISSSFPCLKYVTQAGGKLHPVFISEFIKSKPGIKFYVMYGQTEATARLSYLPPELLERKMGSIGKGIPGTELRVVDKNAQPVTKGQTGEIIARGDNIMKGYLNDAGSTRVTLKDGWLYTGDLGTVDEDGYIYLTSRIKEIIKVRGKRVNPKEIEEIIVTIPEVIDCTVTGIEDDLTGEAIRAELIIDRDNQQLITGEFVKKYCAARLALYKVPQIITFKDKITVSSTGKKVKNPPDTA